MKLILLPGMDGTGELFADFVDAFPCTFGTKIIRYPADQCLAYTELIPFLQSAIPDSEPFVLLAESFSSPLAIQFAASNPQNFRGLVICAGFATSPVRGALRLLYRLVTPILVRAGLPGSATRFLLVGSNAPSSLVAAVRSAISSVRPKVLSSRIHEVLSCDALAALNEVDIPILYIQAKRDRLVPISCEEEIRRIKPKTSVVVIDGPHLLLQRHPQLVAEIVTQFIRELT